MEAVPELALLVWFPITQIILQVSVGVSGGLERAGECS